MPASRTTKTLRPAELTQILPTGLLASETRLELGQIPGIIFHRPRSYILGSPESSKYPSNTVACLSPISFVTDLLGSPCGLVMRVRGGAGCPGTLDLAVLNSGSGSCEAIGFPAGFGSLVRRSGAAGMRWLAGRSSIRVARALWPAFAGSLQPLAGALAGLFAAPYAGSGANSKRRCRLKVSAAHLASQLTFSSPRVANRRSFNFVLIQALGNSASGARCL